jgi:tetratricopeptide (TPR) repeat protein
MKKKDNLRKKHTSKKINEIDFSQIPITDMVNFLTGSHRRKREGKSGCWKVKPVANHEWLFVEPLELDSVYDTFDKGCELLENGNVSQAEKLLRDVTHKTPLHIDALHHLAIILDSKGESEEARRLWIRGVEIGRSAFPRKFISGDRFEWSWLENRPFLRCLHGLGTATLTDGDILTATGIFEELLSYNPHDNQGVREVLLEVYLEQNELKKAYDLCKKYPNDTLAGLWYGYPLVLFGLGKREQASKNLKKVLKESPKMAKELLKKSHKKPKSEMPGYISVGGWDEAYDYWERFSRFWDTEKLDWLREIMNDH